jgi:hypothetical protein
MASPAQWVASLSSLSGPALMDVLTETDLEGLDVEQLLAVLQQWERVLGVAATAHARALRALSRRVAHERDPHRGTLLVDQETTEELALALHVSSAAAGAKLDFADGLALLHHTSTALADGRLGLPHARVLVDVLTSNDPDLDAATRNVLDLRLVQHAAAHPVTPAQLRRQAQQLVMAHDPEGARRRRERAQRRRSVSVRPDDHGMAWLSAYLPAESAHACYATLDGHARGHLGDDPDDDRGLGARRADALVDRLLTGQLDGNAADDASAVSRQVQVNVTVPYTVLLGGDDTPAVLDGHGPIDAYIARSLAYSPEATWRRLVTDPLSDTVLDVGTTRYRPPARLARHVRLRDLTCRWPGCNVHAENCDLDHTTPYPQGPSADHNLVLLCRRHHRLKTLAGFTTAQRFGIWQVTTPSGRTITTEPPSQTGSMVFRPPLRRRL